MGAAGNIRVEVNMKKENFIFLAGMFLFLLVLSRYLVNGEPVDVISDPGGAGAESIGEASESMKGTGDASESTEATGIVLSDGMEIAQPLVIPAGVNWRQGYYALFFRGCDTGSAGELVCTLTQGDWQDVHKIPLKEIAAGEWTVLRRLPLRKLESGTALLTLRTEGVTEGELEIAVLQDHYGFGNFSLNGRPQETTLAQAYHYHITETEYTLRLAAYGIVLLCTAVLVFLVLVCGRESRCLMAFGVLTVMFMAVVYVLDSSVYLEPTYAEAVTNFLRYAREEKLTANLLITDAGYLPLLPRLITLFYVKLLRVPSAWALYFMQATACLLCSMVWAFFVLRPFRGLMRFPNRILWCILVMLSCFCEETVLFTNHAYWGIYLLLLLLAARLEEFPGWVYGVLLGAAALICLSKGTYVVMLPLMVVYLLLFRKSIGKRSRLFAGVTGAAALLQLLYSFSGQGDGGGWIDTASMGKLGYWLRLAGSLFTELGAVLLTPFREMLRQASVSGIVAGVAAAVAIAVLVPGFAGQVLRPVFCGKKIDSELVIFYTTGVFLVIVSAFFLVTVKRVPDSWAAVGRMPAGQMGSKYEIFSNMGFYMLLLTGGALVRKRIGDAKSWAESGMSCGVLLLFAVFCLTNPVVRLTGWADAVVSDGRVYAGDINAGWQDGKKLISENSFFLPVRNENWAYSRNCNLYQVGTTLYFEETSCINLEETLSGYHSSYVIQEETQAQNLIEVMIERPMRVDGTVYRVQLLDADGRVLAETEQMDSGRYRKCLFRFEQPVNGVRTIRFTDSAGNPVCYKDYIAWACAW